MSLINCQFEYKIKILLWYLLFNLSHGVVDEKFIAIIKFFYLFQ